VPQDVTEPRHLPHTHTGTPLSLKILVHTPAFDRRTGVMMGAGCNGAKARAPHTH
jgi:hypothetical protein